MCRTVFFTGTWKIVCCLCTLAHRGERIKKPPCLVIFKKKSHIVHMPFRCVAGQECYNRNGFWIPPPQLKKIFFNNGSYFGLGR